VNRELAKSLASPKRTAKELIPETRRQPLLAVFEFHGVETLGEEVSANAVLFVRRPRDWLFEHDHVPTDTAEPLRSSSTRPGLASSSLICSAEGSGLRTRLHREQPEPAADYLLGDMARTRSGRLRSTT
jgi:hypothetical protein